MNNLAIEKKVLLESAVITCAGVCKNGRFRQRDIRFFIDLYCSWIDPVGQSEGGLLIQNTQIARYCKYLEDEHLLSRDNDLSKKVYFVPIFKMATLLRNLISRDYSAYPQYAFFVFLFIKCYFCPFIDSLVASGGKKVQSTLKKLKDRASPGLFVEEQLYYVDERLQKFDRLFSEQEKGIKSISDKVLDYSEIDLLEQLDKEVQGFLLTRKPIKQIIARGGVDRLQWEVAEGQSQRMQLMWQSEVARLRAFKQQLEGIR